MKPLFHQHLLHENGKCPVLVVVTLGGLTGAKEALPLAQEIVKVGAGRFDALVWDRRNTGRSLVTFEDDGRSMVEQDADDLYELLFAHFFTYSGGLVLYGCSSGARVSAMLASRHPELPLTALILAPPTGGSEAANTLKALYYQPLLEALEEEESMQSVLCRVAHYARMHELRGDLSGTDVSQLRALLHRSMAFFEQFDKAAIIGVSDQSLAEIGKRTPVLVIHHGSSEDTLHTIEAARNTIRVSGAAFVRIPKMLHPRAYPSLAWATLQFVGPFVNSRL